MLMRALIFPGQGSQKVGMGKSLFDDIGASKKIFDVANAALGFDLARILFDGPKERLGLTEITQPAILVHSVASFEALRMSSTVNFDFLAGHSLGEFSALVAAGVISLQDAVKLVHFRGRAMQSAVPQGQGAMAAILGGDAEKIEAACQRQSATSSSAYVAVANFNGPDQTVVSGTGLGVEALSTHLKSQKLAKKVIPLDVSAPFHCELMRPAQNDLATYLKNIEFSDAQIPVVTNVGAQPETSGALLKESSIDQVTRPVQFTRIGRFLDDSGVDQCIELGPGRALSGILKRFTSMECLQIESTVTLEKALPSIGGHE